MYMFLFISFVLITCFFFFKQKTAYEMRISDWSLDVCSSDLPRRPPLDEQDHEDQDQNLAEHGPHSWFDDLVQPADADRGEDAPGQLADAVDHHEIGRASCRERVCQYV